MAGGLRAHYEHNVGELRRLLGRMADLVEGAIRAAVWALIHRDQGEARRVIAGDTAIDDLRYLVEEQALTLIATQQPLAGDLRQLSVLLGLASELERIGDYAEGIARIVLRCAELPAIAPPAAMEQLAAQAREMLGQARRALAAADPAAMIALEQADDVADALQRQAQQELMAMMRADPELVEPGTYYLWAAHNLERIADRTVNIAERAAYAATGELPPRPQPPLH